MVVKLIGELFGIVAGVVGVNLSRTKNDERLKCLWKTFISLVSWLHYIEQSYLTLNYIKCIKCILTTICVSLHYIKCILTTICAIIGFWFTLHWSVILTDAVKSCDSHDDDYYGISPKHHSYNSYRTPDSTLTLTLGSPEPYRRRSLDCDDDETEDEISLLRLLTVKTFLYAGKIQQQKTADS